MTIENFIRALPLPVAGLHIALLSGCIAFSNEGATDFRKAEPFQERKKTDGQKVPAREQAKAARTELIRKDLEQDELSARIEKDDKVSIRLRDGFLRDCNEIAKNPLRGFRKNCEVAVLFRAFELGAGQDFDFKPGAERNARLVYFSHDVQPGQFFNMHNMPVYGPLEYKGVPIGIDIFILEIDAEDKQSFALFKSLAAAGSSAFAPASPVLSLLDGLGSSLLNSGTDDVEFRYSFVLDPAGGYKGTVYATAEAGDYVLVRTEDREREVPWDKLLFDHNTGRLLVKNETGEDQLMREHTYLSLQVLKNAGAVDVSLAQNTYGGFRDALDSDTTSKASDLKANLAVPLEKLALERVQIRAFHKAQKRLGNVVAQCTTQNANHLEGVQAAFDLFKSIQSSVAALGNCGQQSSKALSDMSSDQVDYLLRHLRFQAKLDTPAMLEKYSCAGFAKVNSEDFLKSVCPP
jgi:hypothetical protein